MTQLKPISSETKPTKSTNQEITNLLKAYEKALNSSDPKTVMAPCGSGPILMPAFAQDDPRWGEVRLGPSTDTLGDEGCAVTAAAMVAAFYGIKTDPQQLNAFLTRTGGFTDDGLIHWSRVPAIAPDHLELAYNGGPSYELIDSNLLAGNPVIVLFPLPHGGYHFG